jgi:hypothetical protein
MYTCGSWLSRRRRTANAVRLPSSPFRIPHSPFPRRAPRKKSLPLSPQRLTTFPRLKNRPLLHLSRVYIEALDQKIPFPTALRQEASPHAPPNPCSQRPPPQLLFAFIRVHSRFQSPLPRPPVPRSPFPVPHSAFRIPHSLRPTVSPLRPLRSLRSLRSNPLRHQDPRPSLFRPGTRNPEP